MGHFVNQNEHDGVVRGSRVAGAHAEVLFQGADRRDAMVVLQLVHATRPPSTPDLGTETIIVDGVDNSMALRSQSSKSLGGASIARRRLCNHGPVTASTDRPTVHGEGEECQNHQRDPCLSIHVTVSCRF
jgi:hypothetical protein